VYGGEVGEETPKALSGQADGDRGFGIGRPDLSFSFGLVEEESSGEEEKETALAQWIVLVGA